MGGRRLRPSAQGRLRAVTTRRLAAILVADVVGSSRLIEADEDHALAAIREVLVDLLVATASRLGGRLIKMMGDGALLEFASPVAAVTCAEEVQRALAARAVDDRPERRVLLRIGVNLGDVVAHADGDLYGDGVNVAVRLEGVADPGGIAVSAKVYEELQGKLSLPFVDRGEMLLKNISRPVRVYMIEGSEGLRGGASVPAAKPALALPDMPSIAVLPFTNMSGDAEQEYFADGLVEDIITALSRVKSFFVIARNSTFTYKGRAVDIRQVGRELGVRYVLEGSIRKAGRRLRITGQLIEAETGRHIWADRFDGALEDVFDLQDRLTESVVGAIEPSLQSAEILRAGAKPTDDLGAYDLYLLGLARFHHGSPADLTDAQALLLRAIEIDPNFSLAKGTFARIMVTRLSHGLASPDDVALGARLAEEALAHSRDDPTTLRNAGLATAFLAGQHQAGLMALQRAVAIHPNSAQVLYSSGCVHYYVGQDDTAVEQFDRAIRLSPVDPELPYIIGMLGMVQLARGEYDTALALGQRAIAMNQRSMLAHRTLCAALALVGRCEEAREMGRRMLCVDPTFRLSTFPFPRRPDAARAELIEALRLAGLPE